MSESDDNRQKNSAPRLEISEEKRKEAQERMKKIFPEMEPEQVFKMLHSSMKRKSRKQRSKRQFEEDGESQQEDRSERMSRKSKGSSTARSMKEKKIQKREKDEPIIGRFKHKAPSTVKVEGQLQGMELSARAKLDSFKRKIEIEELSQEDVYTEEEDEDPDNKKIREQIAEKVEHHLKSQVDPLTLNQRQIYSYLMQRQKQYHKGRNFKKWSIRMRRQYLDFVTFNDEIKKYYLDKIGRQQISYDQIEKYNKECRFEGMMKYLPRKLRHIINGRYQREHKEEFEEGEEKRKINGIKAEGGSKPQGQYEYEEEGLDPEFLRRYFSIFAPHNRFLYATALKTQKRAYTTTVESRIRQPDFVIKSDQDIRNLTQIKTAVKILIVKGYSTKGMRAYMQNHNMKRDQYHKFMMAVVRISFRMLQKFMREKVNKQLMYLHHKIVLMMCTPLLNIKFYFSKEEGETATKLWRLVFDVEEFNEKLTKSELIGLYWACKRRQMERQVQRVIPRQVRYNTESYQNEHNQRMHLRKIKYFKYLEFPGQGELGHPNGLQGYEEIFLDQVQQDKVSRFTYEYELQVLKEYLKVRKYQEVRRALLQRVNQIQKYKHRYDMDMIRKVCDKLFRTVIKTVQYEFIQYCRIFGQNKVTWSERKLLTMSACEKEILISRDDQNDAKFLLFDYYINSRYGRPEKTHKQHWDYAGKYLLYTIEAICDFFQTKRHLKSIKMGTPQQQYKMYPLASVYNEHYVNERERLMYENHYHRRISTVFGDGPREVVNVAEDEDRTRPGTDYQSEVRSVAEFSAREQSVARKSLKLESLQSQPQKFNEISVSQLKPAIVVMELPEIRTYDNRLKNAYPQVDPFALSTDEIRNLPKAEKLYCMISRMTKNMVNNNVASLYFAKNRETFEVSEKYYDDGLNQKQIEQMEEERYSKVKNSLTPEVLSYLTKKEVRGKGEDGEGDESDEEEEESSRRESSKKVKRDESENEDEEEFDDEDLEEESEN